MDRVRQIGETILALGLLLWILYRWLRSSQDPYQLLFKFLVSGLDLAFILLVVVPMTLNGGALGALVGVLAGAVAGLIMAILWTPNITSWFGDRFAELYDGGNKPADPEPFYATGEAKRKMGDFEGALKDIQAQLALFPNDFKGQLLVASIQAEDLHDLQAASNTIEQVVTQPDRPAKNIAFALTQMADWRLKHEKNTEAARVLFQRIIDLFPGSTEAHYAHQRIAHLATPETLATQVEHRPLVVPHLEYNIGLLESPPPASPEPALNERATALVDRLNQCPEDIQAREDLAVLYAEGFKRVDLAAEQLEQMLGQPNAPMIHVKRWLNLLADLHIKENGDTAAAKAALMRIQERYPGSAAADVAARRLSVLGLEARAKKDAPGLKLGIYEQNLGLKRRD